MNQMLIVSCAAAMATASATTASAASYVFTDTLGQTAAIDVEYWTGTGPSVTILVIDWNQPVDGSPSSYAFGYRWEGIQTISGMLLEIAAGGGLDVELGYAGGFVYNLRYTNQQGIAISHNEEGSWNLGSTGDMFAAWGTMSADTTMLGEWDANQVGANQEYVLDGQLEGINAFHWFESTRPYQNLDVPFAVPEPGSAALALLSSVLFVTFRRTRVAR